VVLMNQRIGIVVRGGVSPANWSGTPAGLAGGLEACGYDVVVCSADMMMNAYRLVRLCLRAARQPEDGWLVAPAIMKTRELSARWRQRRLPPVSGWIVLGSENGVPVKGPFVTLDDLTVAECRHHPWYFPPFSQGTWDHWQANQRRLFSEARRCFAATEWAAASIIRDYSIASERVEVVGLGRNIDVSAPISRDWSRPRFLFVGSEWDRKNGPAVVEAFSDLRRQFPSAELSIVGEHPPVEVAGVHDYGRLRLDRADDREVLKELLATSTCLVVPSQFEPFGIVYAEAQAAGLAIIGTSRGGAPEVVGPAGLCVDPEDHGAIKNAMLQMADAEVAKRYGSAGPSHVERYSWERIARQMAAALPGVITA